MTGMVVPRQTGTKSALIVAIVAVMMVLTGQLQRHAWMMIQLRKVKVKPYSVCQMQPKGDVHCNGITTIFTLRGPQDYALDLCFIAA